MSRARRRERDVMRSLYEAMHPEPVEEDPSRGLRSVLRSLEGIAERPRDKPLLSKAQRRVLRHRSRLVSGGFS